MPRGPFVFVDIDTRKGNIGRAPRGRWGAWHPIPGRELRIGSLALARLHLCSLGLGRLDQRSQTCADSAPSSKRKRFSRRS